MLSKKIGLALIELSLLSIGVPMLDRQRDEYRLPS